MIKNKILLAILFLFFLILFVVIFSDPKNNNHTLSKYYSDHKIITEHVEHIDLEQNPTKDLQTSYKAYGVKDDVLGMEAIVSDFRNGGNGNHDYPVIMNWSLKSFKQLKNSELFCSKEYVSTLMPFVRKQLVKDFNDSPNILVKPLPKEMIDTINSGTENKPENWENFLISDKGLIVVFPPYQVASGAEGTVHVLIPYKDIPNLLCLPSSI